MKNIRIYQRIIAALLIAAVLQGCRFYKIREASIDEKSATQVIKEKETNFYVVHLGDNLWQIDGTSVQGDTLVGTLKPLHSSVKRYIVQAYETEKFRYPKEDFYYIRQIHIHVNEFVRNGDNVKISNDMITKVDVMSKNKGLSTLATSGIYVGAIGGGIGIFLAIACNCPHTYVFDGKTYQYNNTLYTGATSKNQERNDYKIMPDYQSNSEEYKITIKNEDEELQYTNLLELIVVNHEESTEISMDQDGNIYAIGDPQEPTSIKDNTQADLKNMLAYNDDAGHQFDSQTEEDYNDVIATFKKPADVSNAKIVLKAKNTKWGGFVYKEFSKLFGEKYEDWSKKNHKKSREEVETNLKKTGIPLVVSVKQGENWIDVEEFNMIGDVNYNTLAIKVDEQYLTDENIQIRIRSGFNFWDVDYVAMDFSSDTDVDIQRLSPISASGNTNFKDALALDDDNYMEHLKNGDSTQITFTGLSSASPKRTIYLRSKGYYLPQETYEGKMNRKELVKFRKAGEMSRYSKRLYNQLMGNYALESK